VCAGAPAPPGGTRALHRLLEGEAVRSRKRTQITIETEQLLIIRSVRNTEIQGCANCQKNGQWYCVSRAILVGQSVVKTGGRHASPYPCSQQEEDTGLLDCGGKRSATSLWIGWQVRNLIQSRGHLNDSHKNVSDSLMCRLTSSQPCGSLGCSLKVCGIRRSVRTASSALSPSPRPMLWL